MADSSSYLLVSEQASDVTHLAVRDPVGGHPTACGLYFLPPITPARVRPLGDALPRCISCAVTAAVLREAA